ncbi:hypothetical protein SAMN06265377_0980 [Flagellimonas pacifica]|uniref:Uncharacterized protein n=2 Tax=Flagellimonas pacifica TaxID=1247520 RepID=A0A285MF15_9FLAO|nr:hypothetical protein SAMN06265377_0980 [Allomuricauda parva]
MVIVTTAEEYQETIFKLFKKAGIETFSGSDIDGYKKRSPFFYTSSWFPSERGGVASNLFFSFTEEEKVTRLFAYIKEFNKSTDTANPIRAVEIPIERSI